MVAYVKAEKKADVKQVMISKVNSFIESIVPTLRDDSLFWVKSNLPICQNFSTNESDIPICDYEEYLIEETTEKFKLAVNFPLIIHLLMSLFHGYRSKSGFKSPIVDGLIFEDEH